MKKPIIKIVNIETGEEIEREMTDVEFDNYQLQQKASEEIEANELAKAAAKAALLEKLGITEEEAKLLLG